MIVTHLHINDLQVEEYVFYFSDRRTVELDCYTKKIRKTKRHKFVIDEIWDRLNKKCCNIPKPEISDEVYKEVIAEYANSIKILK